MASTPMKLLLRIYADCEDDEQARDIAGRMDLALQHLSPVEFAPPRPYWKMAHQFEFTRLLHPATLDSVARLLGASATGWTRLSEAEAVWNRQAAAVFLVPETGWAHVELQGLAGS